MRLLYPILIILSLKAPQVLRASIFGEETAVLIEILSTTARQLNELEKLVSNTEKYTKRMRQYNELIEDEYFKAERIAYLAEEIAAKKEVDNLGDLNSAISSLKTSMSDLREEVKTYGKIISEEKKQERINEINSGLITLKQKRAKKQVNQSIRSSHTGRSTQLNAQNTALIHETQLEMQKDQSKLLKEVMTTNRLLSEELREKKLKEIEKRKRYGLE